MELLDYLKLAGQHISPVENTFKIALVTNFTDDLFKKGLTGMCLAEGIVPDLYQVPFKQYLFELKNPASAMHAHKPRVTFVFFDINPYQSSEFLSDKNHAADTLRDVERFAKAQEGVVVLHLLPERSGRQQHRLLKESPVEAAVSEFNAKVRALEAGYSNIRVIDTRAVIHRIGEPKARDLRGLYAFSMPWSNDFTFALLREWMALVRPLAGRIHKCLVLDLDNVLWGGVVGEVGPLGIELGSEYPGNAYVEFQRTLLEFYNRGILLAINSRNNESDVEDVFEKNKHMLLQKKHFAARAINWGSKAENIKTIAKELNIGTDSLVFIDDDPANRELVRAQVPDVLVPEWTMPPEEYVHALLDLDAFHAGAMSAEDAARSEMYAVESERKKLAETLSIEEYIASLKIEIDISINDPAQLPRVAQLTQKTNQFNLSTHRSSEEEIAAWIERGAMVYAGDVRDTFGAYGITALAIITPNEESVATLTTFLMSCRVMGRGVEQAFFRALAKDLFERGVKTLKVPFVPSQKNAPVAAFAASLGGAVTEGPGGAKTYTLALKPYLEQTEGTVPPVAVAIHS